MLFKCRIFFYLIRFRIITLIGYQAYLGINYNVLIFGQMNYYIRLSITPFIGAQAFLNYIFTTLAKPRIFQQTLQHKFTPIALGFSVTLESIGEIYCVFTDTQV